MTVHAGNGHLAPEQLDDVLDGIDDEHTPGCAQCAAALAAMADVRERLADARQDVPMPDGLANRLARALAAQDAAGRQPASGGAAVIPLAGRRRRTVLAVAAAVAALGIGGGLVVGQQQRQRATSEAGAAAPAGAQDAAAASPETRELLAQLRLARAGEPSTLVRVPPSACAGALGLPGTTETFSGTWQGRPAVVLVDPQLDVQVVDADCSEPRVLERTHLDR